MMPPYIGQTDWQGKLSLHQWCEHVQGLDVGPLGDYVKLQRPVGLVSDVNTCLCV